jgi:hypothetical protein
MMNQHERRVGKTEQGVRAAAGSLRQRRYSVFSVIRALEIELT